jgi:hypothetical protein
VFGNYVGQGRSSVMWGSQHHSRSVIRKEIAQFHPAGTYNLEVATRFSENLRIGVINRWDFYQQASNYYDVKNSVPRDNFHRLEGKKFPSKGPTQCSNSKNTPRLRKHNDPRVTFFSWSCCGLSIFLCDESTIKRGQ